MRIRLLPLLACLTPVVVNAADLDAGRTRIVFAGPERGFAVDRIVDVPSGVSFCGEQPKNGGLWRLAFRTGVTGREVVLDAVNEKGARMELTPLGLRFVWSDLSLGEEKAAVDVVCDVVRNDSEGDVEFRISVDNRSSVYGLWETLYPRLDAVAESGRADALLPRGNWGAHLARACREEMNVTYPSFEMPMQFTAFHKRGVGLYFAAHDGRSSVKRFRLTADQSVAFETPARDAGVAGGNGAPAFPVIVSTYVGDWWQAAAKYRRWAMRQRWTAQGPTARRMDRSDRLAGNAFWMHVWGDPAFAERTVAAVLSRTDGNVPFGIHWYCWHQIPFDHSYPEYFPAKAGFEDAVRRMREKGVLVMPYINGRLWDRDLPGFAAVRECAACAASGEPMYETYGTGRHFAAMCPGTVPWGAKMLEVTSRLFGSGCDGVYIDQIGSASPVLCFGESHGHPLGGGSHWTDGYRRMLTPIRKSAVACGAMLATENTAEPYMDSIDAYLTWTPDRVNDVPALPAVYSGYTTWIGSPQDADVSFESFQAAQVRDILWGVQPGWMDDWILDDGHRKHFDCMLRLAKTRLSNRAWFGEGTLLGEVVNEATNRPMTVEWKANGKRQPPAETAPTVAVVWENRAGERLLAIGNLADHDCSFRGTPPGGREVVCALAPGEVKIVRYTVPPRDVTTFVNPFIGTARSGNGHTYAAASSPFGMVQPGPDTGSTDWAYCSGYLKDDPVVFGFSQTHLNGTGCPEMQDFLLAPFTGDCSLTEGDFPVLHGLKDFATEMASPGYYAVSLTNFGVRVELTATPRVAFHRYAFSGRSGKVMLDTQFGNTCDCGNHRGYVRDCRCSFSEDRRHVDGHRVTWGWLRRETSFALEFGRPYARMVELPPKTPEERGRRYVFEFDDLPGGVLDIRIALSSCDEAGARRNLAAEGAGLDFESARRQAEAAWNAQLGRMETPGADTMPDIRACFYSALYRLCLQPAIHSDVDGRYRGADFRVHDARHASGRKDVYSHFSLWDTFRAAHPLYTLVAPERVDDFCESLIDQWRDVGFLPILSYAGCESYCMVGKHSVPVLADAWLKGFRGFDDETAFRAVKDSLTREHEPVYRAWNALPKEEWSVLDRYGYYPCDAPLKTRVEQTSRTLEQSYDDACAARLSAALGKTKDAAFFAHRSGNWTNVFDASVGFARGRRMDGGWRTPFDPSEINNVFTEGNAYQYSWHVLHDVPALARLLGGEERMVRRLDALFCADGHIDGVDATPDVSGLIGQYAHGNEPSHHIAYLYACAGRPDRTAERVREICARFYRNAPDGLPGNDDCGQMGAWYVFACMGFYPVDPCGGDFVLGAPQLPETVLRLPGGRVFRVVAQGLSRERQYVASVKLDGKPLKGCRIAYADIMRGGELVFEMTSRKGR